MTSSTRLPSHLLRIADDLWRAERTRRAIAPPAVGATLSVADAYAVQQANVARRVAEGEVVIGRKVGLTSEAIQRQLGVDQPDYGVITDAMRIADGAELVVDELIAPRVEAEFAFLIGRDLPAAPSVEELTDAIVGVGLALEIIDSRVADWRISLVDTVADNASSARIAHGEFSAALSGRLASLPETVITMTRDEDVVSQGPGAAVLGDPLTSLHWLATAIGAYGERFRADDVVLAGAVSAAVTIEPGHRWSARAEGFAPVTITTR